MDKQFFKIFTHDKNLITAFLCFFAIISLNSVLFKGFIIGFFIEVLMFSLAALLLTYCVFVAEKKHEVPTMFLCFITAMGISPIQNALKVSYDIDKAFLILTIIVILFVVNIYSKTLFVFPLVATTVFLYFYPIFFILLLPLFVISILAFVGKEGFVFRLLSVFFCFLFSLMFFIFFEKSAIHKALKMPDKYILSVLLSVLPYLVLVVVMWVMLFKKTEDKSVKLVSIGAIVFPLFVLFQSLFFGKLVSPVNWIVLTGIGLMLTLFSIDNQDAVQVVEKTNGWIKQNLLPVSLAFLFAYAIRSYYLFMIY